LAGLGTALLVQITRKEWSVAMLKGISWDVFPLVAGLFVLVEALARTGLLTVLGRTLQDGAHRHAAAWIAGSALALLCNLMNNLPAGLIVGSAIQSARVPQHIVDALLVGVDLGPNLSVTGSLATILWLAALRREGMTVSFGRFLRVGVCVMPPALLLSLAALEIF
jgi:arsenical pump membrane protein